MGICLLIDFGSTYTKVLAVDVAKESIVGRCQAYTTIDTDITVGLYNALSSLEETCGIDIRSVQGLYGSSSAAGGLKMAAIGLVPQLTVEAARRACLGAGAKVVCAYGYEIDEGVVRDIESAGCDIILLCGGTDGGDKDVIIHNAGRLADSEIDAPIVIAGNRAAADKIKAILEKANKTAYTTKNVLPSLEVMEVEPAQNLIRQIFVDHITKAKGLSKAQNFVGRPIVPTPMATLRAAALLADGAGGESGLGSLMVVEIGGATTNIHSVADSLPAGSRTIVRGLPESRVKRTVEGDLGIRYNAPVIYDLLGGDRFVSKLRALEPSASGRECDPERHVRYLSRNVGHVPSTSFGQNVDAVLAESAASIAVQRHAGVLRQEYSVAGEITVQYGKNLLHAENLIGTGGIFKYGTHPERILRSALFDPETPWSLKPRSPKAYIDSVYMLYGIGLLAEDFPVQALRIGKKYLRQTALDGHK